MLAPLALAFLTVQIPTARTSTAPLPAGKQVVAKDGDVVVVDRGARVRLIRRNEGVAREIYNAVNFSLQ
jgi:hypothetical protein